MTNGYLTFLDYLELRRRVEKRLNSGNWFLMHVILFGVGAAFIASLGWSTYYLGYFIHPNHGISVTFWSGILLVHGLLTYWRSGARSGRRDQTIENEMRERLQADDLYLSQYPKDLFRLHGLLTEDIRKRSSLVPILLFFVFINACIWIPWTLAGQANTSYAWMVALGLSIPLVLSIMWNIGGRVRHKAQLRKQLEQYFGNEQIDDERNYERETRLSDDNDELITVDGYMLKQKRR